MKLPRYLVERTFYAGTDSVARPPLEALASSLSAAINARWGVFCVHSYVAESGGKSFCLVEASSPMAIRQAAEESGLPVSRITAVSLLDPERSAAHSPSPNTQIDRCGTVNEPHSKKP